MHAPTEAQLALKGLFDLHIAYVRGGAEKPMPLEIVRALWYAECFEVAKNTRAECFFVERTPYFIWPARLIAFIKTTYA